MESSSEWVSILDWIIHNYEKLVFILVFVSGLWTYIYRMYDAARSDNEQHSFQDSLQEEIKRLRIELHVATEANNKLRAELLERVRSKRNTDA